MITVHLVVEGADADAQERCRAFAVLVALGEGGNDGAPFGFPDDVVQAGYAAARGLVGEIGGQVWPVDDRLLDGNDELFHDVAELADVAGPGEIAERAHRGGGDVLELAVMADRGLFKEELDELRDVVAPLAQRGEAEANDTEPVVDITAQAALCQEFVGLAAGGDHQAHVEWNQLFTPDAAELALFDDAQQVDLGFRRHLRDLIEKECAPAPISNHPGFGRMAPFEAPFS